MQKKKILLLAADLKCVGGVANYYNAIRLHDEEYIDFFSVNAANPQPSIVVLFRLLFNYLKLFQKIILKRYNLIHVNPSLNKRSFYRDAVFILIARLTGRNVLVFFRGWCDKFEAEIKSSSFKSFLFRISYAKADKMVVLSNSFKEKLIALGVPSDTPFFIETTVADSRYLPEFNLDKKFQTFEDELTILFLARVEREKGIYIAIDAFREFLIRHPEKKVKLIVAGDGEDLPQVKQYVSEQNIPRVTFTGYVRNEKRKEVLLNTHIMLFPTYYGEGLPNCVLEGMLYGMPVISRINAGITDVVCNGENGFLSGSLDPQTFTEFLSTIAFNKQLYQDISQCNHKTAMKKFVSEKVRRRILEIYETFYTTPAPAILNGSNINIKQNRTFAQAIAKGQAKEL